MHNLRDRLIFMSTQPGRARRRDGAVTVLLQGKVTPERRTAVSAAADDSGLSLSFYLDTLVRHLEENGGLPVFPRPKPQAEELPIQAA